MLLEFIFKIINMASCWPPGVDFMPIAILLTTLISFNLAVGQQQAPVAVEPSVKIPIPNLPSSHYQFWLKNSPSALANFERICSDSAPNQVIIKDLKQFKELHSNLTFEDTRVSTDLSYSKRFLQNICSKISLVRKSCWGYEANCDIIYLMPECNSSSSDHRSEQEKKIEWFSQADFGYVLDRRRELSRYCAPDKHSNHSVKSSLECTKYFKMCRGENLYLKLDDNQSALQEGPMSLRKGHVGGWNCDLQVKRIQEESSQRGFLKSWFNELKNYGLLHRIQPEKACEERIDKQVYLVQLDSSDNMYHYFRTFLNLYATMHLNNRFSDDNQLVLWDKGLPQSNFEVMWSVFSKNRPRSLDEFEGKQVCLKKFIFTMPPRMDGGLYYNTPLVDGCSKSGLFDAFNKHVLYRLGIDKQDHVTPRPANNRKISVTIVSRSTPTRRILNEADLKDAADNISAEFQTRVVDFANMTFIDQLKITHSTDILVGIHGAGLTHTLFLPDSAALIELYDCKDECYRNLARLRGVKYFTLEDQENSGDKSENFTVNVQAFVKALKAAAEEVKKQKVEPIIDEPKVELKPVEKEDESKEIPEVKAKVQQDRTEL